MIYQYSFCDVLWCRLLLLQGAETVKSLCNKSIISIHPVEHDFFNTGFAIPKWSAVVVLFLIIDLDNVFIYSFPQAIESM